MPEHRIRLRAAWVADLDGGPARVDLPTDWSTRRPACPFRIHRGLRLPAIGPAESAFLDLDSVAGLLSVRFDDCRIAEPGGDLERLSLAINDRVPRRIVLSLEIDPIRAIGPAWGVVSIRITG